VTRHSSSRSPPTCYTGETYLTRRISGSVRPNSGVRPPDPIPTKHAGSAEDYRPAYHDITAAGPLATRVGSANPELRRRERSPLQS
jgi:hypothetical protein